MIVDDNKDLAESLQEILDDKYNTDLFHTAESALLDFKKKPYKYDAIIMDIVLPGKSGIECFLEMKKINKKINTIFITGNCIIIEKEIINNKNVIELMKKPLNIEKLLDYLEKIKKNFTAFSFTNINKIYLN